MGFFLGWEVVLEILILWGMYYLVYLLFKGTAAEQVLKGIIVISLVVLLTRGLNLVIINWMLTRLLAISVVAFLIIFQPEIRRGLARIGRFGVFPEEKETIGEISKSCAIMSKRRIGGLVAIERETGLRRYVESGVSIDARVTSELINTIFSVTTPLHDGGIIVSHQRIEAAACLFPLTQNPDVPKSMGTRHRAALGLSEETDAVVVVVSEETGGISVASGGRITTDIDPKNLVGMIEKAYMPRERRRSFPVTMKRFFEMRRSSKGVK
jgi:diadenylate cyclase